MGTDDAGAPVPSMATVGAWGKFDSDTKEWHRLEYHSADVAYCMAALLEDSMLAKRLATAARVARLSPVVVARLCVAAYFHDFGKLNAGFQHKVLDVRTNDMLPKAGHISEGWWAWHNDHPSIKPLGLNDLCEQWGDGMETALLAAMTHHGRQPQRPNPGHKHGMRRLWESYNEYDPSSSASDLRQGAELCFPLAFTDSKEPMPEHAAFHHLLAGVIAIADQLGSNRSVFTFNSNETKEYFDLAMERAEYAIRETGHNRGHLAASIRSIDVQTLFGHAQPRPLQQVIRDVDSDDQLTILESETGSGKTEAALLRFADLLQAGKVDGLYFALPTRAAAMQIQKRVQHAISRLFPRNMLNDVVLAVPGYLKAGDIEGHYVSKFDVQWDDDAGARRLLSRWSAEAPRKYTTATIAVGTVDQALMAALRTKFAHFRAAGLSRSLLVVDEVHASDHYMTGALEKLLTNHTSVGGYAFLMSATLGASARAKFTRSAEQPFSDAVAVPYPCITTTRRSTHEAPLVLDVPPTGYAKSVSVRTEDALAAPQAVGDLAVAAAKQGAAVLVIRNTVGTAQELFSELASRSGDADLLMSVDSAPTLHHSRFAVEDRKVLDHRVESILGAHRRASDGSGVIVVGTQTLEQSLDIDADMLITDLCPCDVLLQRIGRLHRHAGRPRPHGFSSPQCAVLVPVGGMSGLAAGLTGDLMAYGMGCRENDPSGVYENMVALELTRRLITGNPIWDIPTMNRWLVESATHPNRMLELANTLGDKWPVHLSLIEGTSLANIQLSTLNALSWQADFDDRNVAIRLDEKVPTRIGSDRYLVKLDAPIIGPFGTPVTSFALSEFIFKGNEPPSQDDLQAATAERTAIGGLKIMVGEHEFLYDSQGVHRA